MDAEQIRAWTELVAAVAWPLVVVAVLAYLGRPLKKFLENASEFSFSAAGFQASARRQVEVAASLAAAEALRTGPDGQRPDGSAETTGRDVARTVDRVLTPRVAQRLDRVTVLWVDDSPENNAFEARALEAAGITVVRATTTERGVEMARVRPYDVVITDMGRPGDSRAGYTLLAQLREAGIRTPVVIYSAGGSRSDNRQEARQRGAFGSTQSPQELFELVLTALAGP